MGDHDGGREAIEEVVPFCLLFDEKEGILFRSKSRTRFSLECKRKNRLNLKKLVRDISITVLLQ